MTTPTPTLVEDVLKRHVEHVCTTECERRSGMGFICSGPGTCSACRKTMPCEPYRLAAFAKAVLNEVYEWTRSADAVENVTKWDGSTCYDTAVGFRTKARRINFLAKQHLGAE